SLEAVKKNLQAATNNIDKSQTRSRAMMRALRRVDELEAGESLKLLPELQQEEMFGGEDEEES
ncbi:MAG: hypothetical protein SFY68_05075, partial [Candidatus Sumerlaeia bacterium]|nr:hypothetical protein [Candidatus Sumerlaeia bacterium]